MKKTIKATDIKLTEAISSYIEKIVSTIDKHIDHSDDSALVDIEVGRTTYHHKSGAVFKAEVTLYTKWGTFRSVAEKDDLYAAIDDVKDEISEMLGSRKKRRLDFIRRSGLKVKNLVRGFYTKGKYEWKRWRD